MNLRNVYFLLFVCLLMSKMNTFSQNKIKINSNKNSKLTSPPYLKKGDSIVILAPAGILKDKQETIQVAKKLVENWGLKVGLGEHLFSKNNHFAGEDYERTSDFQKAINNPNIKAIWAARGGYGSVRILDRLNYIKFLKNPKWIIGYSDITAFHSYFHNLKVETLHAMMCINVDDDIELSKEAILSFKNAIFGKKLSYKIPSSIYNKRGSGKGQIVGGNLMILTTMLGSSDQLNTKGKVIFIEEIGEYKYSIDRMLYSLKRAGYFDECTGLIVGNISNIKENTTVWGHTIEELILDVVKEYDFPVMFDFPAGHEPDNRALILGRKIKLKVRDKYSSVIFKK